MNQVLKRLVRSAEDTDSKQVYYTEIQTLREALQRAGFDADYEDIQWAWEEHSKDFAAGFLLIEGNGDDQVCFVIERLCEEEEGR